MAELEDIKFEDIPRNLQWRDVFDTIDENFHKVSGYFKTIGSKIRIDTFTALEGQDTFVLSTEYTTRNNSIEVYRNGVRQFLNTGFKEASNKSFSLTSPCRRGEIVIAIYVVYYVNTDNRDLTQVLLDEFDAAKNGMDGVEYGSLSDAIRNQILYFANQQAADLQKQMDELIESQNANDQSQEKNNADQAANNLAAQGLQFKVLVEGEYDPDTLMPTIEGKVGLFYLSPYGEADANGNDLYAEWLWIEEQGKFERVGNTSISSEPLTTDEIDQVINGQELVSKNLFNGTNLSYYDKRLKQRTDASIKTAVSEIKVGGVFMFQIEDGDLYALYDDQTDPPEFELDGSGDLYALFDDAATV